MPRVPHNDLSDEAKEAWTRMVLATCKNESKEDEIQSAQIGWQECRRRAEAIITQAKFEQYDTITKQAKEIADLKSLVANLREYKESIDLPGDEA